MKSSNAVCLAVLALGLAPMAAAQGSGPTSIYNFNRTYHIGFDKPEAWGLKYFASTSVLGGLPVMQPSEGHKVGSVNIGLETDWLPNLDAGQRQIGFNGSVPEDRKSVV